MRDKLGNLQGKGRLLLATAVVVLGGGIGAGLALGGSASAACGYGVPCKPKPCPMSLTPRVIHRGNLVLVKGQWCANPAADAAAGTPKVKIHSGAFVGKNAYAKLTGRTYTYKKKVKVGSKVKPGKYKVTTSYVGKKLATKTLTVKK